jgi:hypothetical protein
MLPQAQLLLLHLSMPLSPNYHRTQSATIFTGLWLRQTICCNDKFFHHPNIIISTPSSKHVIHKIGRRRINMKIYRPAKVIIPLCCANFSMIAPIFYRIVPIHITYITPTNGFVLSILLIMSSISSGFFPPLCRF